jgi:ribosomal protein S6--L-glutamate ligase
LSKAAPRSGGGEKSAIVLTRNPYLYTVRKFASACARRGWKCEVIDPFLCGARIGAANGGGINYEGKPLSPDLVFNRLASLASDYSVAIAAELESRGSLVINPAAPTDKYRNKYSALKRLEEAELRVPETALVRVGQDINAAIDSLGGPPVVLKYVRGSQGLGVIFGESYDAVTSIIESLNLIQYDTVLQRYYPQAKELDLRILVLGGKAIAGARRVASADDFRSNFHRGGMLYRYDIPDDIAEMAVRASDAMGLYFAGVDIIGGPDGPIVLEVNLSPGFEGMDQVHGRDIAEELCEWAAAQLEKRIGDNQCPTPSSFR